MPKAAESHRGTMNPYEGKPFSEDQEFGMFHGLRVSVFGPNYIFNGKLVKETKSVIVLGDGVYQVYETGNHKTPCEDQELICPVMAFPKTAICNVGCPVWVEPTPPKN